MDNQEINKRIAEIKGLDAELRDNKVFIFTTRDVVHDPIYNAYIADYITDPALILELELELLKAGWYPVLLPVNEKYLWTCPLYDKEIEPNKDFGKATALAWLEEFK